MVSKEWAAIGALISALILVFFLVVKIKKPPPSLSGRSCQISHKAGMIYYKNKPYTGELVKYFHNGKKRYLVNIINGLKQGLATEWHKNGKKKTEVTMKDGMTVGCLNGWHENGNKAYTVPLVNGETEGIVIEYYPSGNKHRRTKYKKGEKHGNETGFDEANNMLWKTTWKNDGINGEYVEFYSSGRTRNITTYIKGIRNGLATGFFRNGKKSWTAKWSGETPLGTHMEWHETNNEKSRLKRQKTFYKGKLISLCDWHNNGQRSLEAAYTNGQLQWQKRWNKDGRLILTTSEANAIVSSDTISNQKPLPAKSPPTVGRRTIWEKTRLNAIYSGKPLETVRVVFGPPDHKLGNTWIYSNLRIIDSKSLQRYTTAHFLIQHKKVLGVDVLFN